MSGTSSGNHHGKLNALLHHPAAQSLWYQAIWSLVIALFSSGMAAAALLVYRKINSYSRVIGVDMFSLELVQWVWRPALLLAVVGVLLGILVYLVRRPVVEFPAFVESVSRDGAVPGQPLQVYSGVLALIASAVGVSVGFATSAMQLCSAGVDWLIERFIGTPDRETRRLMIACSGAAALSTVLTMPLFAILLVHEIMQGKKFQLRSAALVTLGATVGYIVSRLYLGSNTMLANISFMPVTSAYELVGAAVFGGVMAVVALGFHFLLNQSVVWVTLLPQSLQGRPLLMGAGAIVMAMIALVLPQTLGISAQMITSATAVNYVWWFVVVLWVAKVFTVVLSHAVGFRGDWLLPSIAIGALTGSLVGALMVVFAFDGLWANTLPIIGIAVMVAVVYGSPLAAIILVLELTKTFGVVLPATIGVVAALLTTEVLSRSNK